MSEPFIGEVKIISWNFPPKGWAYCNGQLLPINQNQALFSILGTTYGGDGRSNFVLPNLQGCAPLQAGQGPGLSLYELGESGGVETVTLLQTEMPAHAHGVQGTAVAATSATPTGNTWGAAGRGRPKAYASGAATVQMHPFGTSVAGGRQPHNNMPPYLGLTFIIALQGIYPSRS